MQDSTEEEDVPTVNRDRVRLQLRPPLGEMPKLRVTFSVKPLSPAMEMVEVPAPPALTVKDCGVAVMVKSFTVKGTAA